MNRLQKKCLIAATGVHLLLFVVLVVGPAFMSGRSRTIDLPIIEFIPVITTDKPISGGGDPTVKSPPAQATTPANPQRPTPAPTLPVRQTPRPTESSPQRHQVKVSNKLVTTSPTRTSDPTRQQEEDARRRALETINKAVEGIRGGVAGSTEVRLAGPGGGGLPYANWLQAVKSRYSNAWVVPDGVTDDSATTTVSVTIGRDGTVLSARITNPSGNALVDRSIRATLDRVTFAAPLPADAKEDERTVTISFNVRAKLSG